MCKLIQLAFVLLALPAVGCGPSQEQIDRANRLNELHQRRADQDVLEYLEENPQPSKE